MEGILYKHEGLFSGWTPYFYILHDDELLQMTKDKSKVLGTIHLKVAKVASNPRDSLAIEIFTGTQELTLRASTIKEKVDWINGLLHCQQRLLDQRYEKFYAEDN